MRSDAIIPAAIAAAGLLLYFLYDCVRRRKKRRARIDAAFGKAPAQPRLPRSFARDYWAGLAPKADAARCIDEMTWSDLSIDDIFGRINICQSTVGEAYLYAALHRLEDDDTLAARARLRAAFAAAPAARLNIQVLLSRLGDGRGAGFSTLLFAPHLARLPFPALYHVCAFLPLAMLPSLFFGSAALWFLAAVCLNTVLYYRARDQVRAAFDSLGYFSALLATAKKLSRGLRPLSSALSGALEEALRPLRPLLGASAALARPASGELGDMAVELLSAVTLFPVLYYHRAVRVLEKEQPSLCRVCALVGEVELAIASASLCASLPVWCSPAFCEETGVSCEALVHPLLDAPVPNSARFARGTLFTGSNASGKSTFIKALAVNAILAQTLGVCTARALRLPRALVVTSMAVADDICAGESYFIAELNSLRRVVTCADSGAPCLCFVDEILKGTNTVERIAASAAVLRRLAGAPRCLFFVATHDVELTDMLADICDDRHFSEQVTPEGVVFDYTLRDGPARTRNAILLLDTLGFPEEVTAAARRTASRFAATGKWAAARLPASEPGPRAADAPR